MNDQAVKSIRIEPTKGWVDVGFRNLYEFRGLLYFLIWRDIKVRYKQTVLGASWAVIQPFFLMVVFSIFFGKLGKIPSDGLPYPLFSFAALVPWMMFAHGLTMASNSVVSNGRLIKKVYFPRLIMPIAAVLASVVDFVIAFVVLVLMGFYYGVVPTINVLWLPLLVLLALVTAMGVAFWLGAMNVQFRDVRYMIPFLVQFWLFMTPIAYPSSLIVDPFMRALYALNPMVGVVEGFRWALLGTDTAPGSVILISALAAITIFVTGVFYFRRLERSFADVV